MANWKNVANKLRSANGGVAKAVKNTKSNASIDTKLNNMASAAKKTTKASRNKLSSKIGTGKLF